MTEYITMTGITMFFSEIYRIRSKKGKGNNSWYYLSILPMIIISSARVNIGSDYFNYEYYLERTWSNGNLEYGYILLQNSIRFLHGNYRFLLIVTSVLFVLLITLPLRRNAETYTISIFLLIFGLYYFQSLCHIRFMIAIGITVCSIKYVKERKAIKFVALVILATGFHRSTAICLVLYPLYGRKLGIIEFPVILLGVYAVSRRLSNIVSLLGISSYMEYLSASSEQLVGLFVMNFMIFTFYIAVLCFHKDLLKNKEYVFYLRCQYMVSVIALFSGFIPLAGRIGTIIQSIQLISLPFVISRVTYSRNRLIVLIIIAISFIAYFYYSIVINKGFGVYPYQHI